MAVSVSDQARIFLCAVIGGGLIAFIYDILRIKRRTIKTSAVVVNLEDLMYWIIVALVLFLTVYYSNDGELRGYIFIGTAIGVVLYILILSRIVIGVSVAVIRAVCKIAVTVWKILTYPFKVILRFLSIPCLYILKKLLKAFKAAKRAGRSRAAKAAAWGRILKNARKKI